MISEPCKHMTVFDEVKPDMGSYPEWWQCQDCKAIVEIQWQPFLIERSQPTKPHPTGTGGERCPVHSFCRPEDCSCPKEAPEDTPKDWEPTKKQSFVRAMVNARIDTMLAEDVPKEPSCSSCQSDHVPCDDCLKCDCAPHEFCPQCRPPKDDETVILCPCGKRYFWKRDAQAYHSTCARSAKLEQRLAKHYYARHEVDKLLAKHREETDKRFESMVQAVELLQEGFKSEIDRYDRALSLGAEGRRLAERNRRKEERERWKTLYTFLEAHSSVAVAEALAELRKQIVDES